MGKITLVVGLIATVLLAFAGSRATAQEEDRGPPMRAAVERDGETWSVRFHFPSDSPVWAFRRSALTRTEQIPWRPDSWRVTTPGVTLERLGEYDALVVESGAVPREVMIEFTPAAVDLIADYDPALIFSTGAVALYAGHFRAFPVAGREEALTLQNTQSYPSEVSLRDLDAPVIIHGEAIDLAEDVGEIYVIFGEVERFESEWVATVLDPGLPQWLQDNLAPFADATFAYYTARLGEHAGGRPTVMASWAGPTPAMISQGGSVTPDMIAMRFEGIGLVEPDADALERAHWFVGHEGAHVWLGNTIAYTTSADAWITEGGADLLAAHLVEEIGTHDGTASSALTAQARSECTPLLANGGIASAAQRLEHRAYYACGMLFALAVERAGEARGEDFLDFVALLIDRHRESGQVTAEQWFVAAADFGVAPGKIALMRKLIENGSADGAADLDALLGLAT